MKLVLVIIKNHTYILNITGNSATSINAPPLVKYISLLKINVINLRSVMYSTCFFKTSSDVYRLLHLLGEYKVSMSGSGFNLDDMLPQLEM